MSLQQLNNWMGMKLPNWIQFWVYGGGDGRYHCRVSKMLFSVMLICSALCVDCLLAHMGFLWRGLHGFLLPLLLRIFLFFFLRGILLALIFILRILILTGQSHLINNWCGLSKKHARASFLHLFSIATAANWRVPRAILHRPNTKWQSCWRGSP